MNYNIEKVSPRPWKHHPVCAIEQMMPGGGSAHSGKRDADNFVDADGNEINPTRDNTAHLIHCVNEHDRIRAEVEKLRDEADQGTGLLSITAARSFQRVLDLLDGES